MVPVCGVTSSSWQRDCERGIKKTFGKNKKNTKKKQKEKKCSKAAKQRSQVLAEPLFFSAHCLRYATVQTKYNEEWLKQTRGKQILTRYSSWLSCVLLPPLQSVAFLLFYQFYYLKFLSKDWILFFFSPPSISFSFYLCTLRELITAGHRWWARRAPVLRMSVLQRATRLLDWICSQRMAKQTAVYLTCILVIQCVCEIARREIKKLLNARISHSSCSVSSLRIWFLLSTKPWGNFRASKLRKVINLQNAGVAISGISGRRCFFFLFFLFFLQSSPWNNQ